MSARRPPGFSILELMIAMSASVFILVWIVDWVRKPQAIQDMMLATDTQRRLASASGALLNDLLEADPSSIPWAQLAPITSTPTAGIAFWKLRYDLGDPDNPTQTSFQYQFQPDGSGRGSLVRVVTSSGTTASTVVLSPIDEPGVTVPHLVQADKAHPDDADYSILVITMQYHPTGAKPVTIVRRIAMPI